MDELKFLEKVERYAFPGIGEIVSGKNSHEIFRTRDGKSFFLKRNNETLVFFPTNLGVPAFYQMLPVKMPAKIKAVLMDLDGTSVKSEEFWIWVIEEIVRRVVKNEKFRFEETDLPHVSGFSVSEHLAYAINKYLKQYPEATLAKAQEMYFEIVRSELKNIAEGKTGNHSFAPSPHLKEFLLALKEKGVKIGLVSSGLYEKAWPEILSVFKTLSLGNPLDFYDAIVTAGSSIRKGHPGTLGELEAKPHPWLYAEALHALHLKPEEAIVLEDSGAGVLSARTAKMPVIGVAGGNIESGGEKSLCMHYCDDLGSVLKAISPYL